MSKFSHFKAPAIYLALLATMMLSACATTSTETAKPVAEPEPVMEIEPWDGDGMEIPLDGSSMEAWDRSMARVEAYSDEKIFITLENAIDYLLVYDLASYKDKEKLIKRLDGLTGYQILQKINWRKPAPGKGPAEKGAADAKIIDS